MEINDVPPPSRDAEAAPPASIQNAARRATAPKTRKRPTQTKAAVTKKKATKRKATKKKATKAATKKLVTKKAAVKKAATKKKATPAKKAAGRKPVTKKVATKKVAKKKKPGARKAATKKVTVKKQPTKKNAGRTKAAASRPEPPVEKAAAEASAPGTRRRRAVAGRRPVTAVSKDDTPDARDEPRIQELPREPEPPTPPESEKPATGRRRSRRHRTERRGRQHSAPRGPSPVAGHAIPPLPDEEEEIVPFEETPEPELPREAPTKASPETILKAVQKGEMHVSALNRLTDAQVATLARTRGCAPREGERRSDTLYRLLQEAPVVEQPKTAYVDGLLELHPDGYGFLRRPERSYTQHPEDVYVSAGLIRKLGLKPGHWISGTARPSRPGEPLLALHRVEEVNHEDPEKARDAVPFENLTVVYPDERFLLEVTPDDLEMRVMDLFCPLGRGQRALIVSPPRAGKTIILQKLADSIAHNSPNVDIVVLLVDERPEEVTNMKRSVRGEVIASTFDRPASNHVRVAELVMEKVKRMVEFGRHVVLLLDSITRLGRAYNNMAGPSGRILTGGLEAKALTKPKRFFGAARNIEDGGSLTIVATALVDTGSRMDDVIFEEFKGSGNMEVVLDRELANARIWPAIDLPASGTRNEDLLLHPEELRRVNVLRRAMTGRDPQSVMEGMREQMEQYRTNAELLMSIS